MTCFPIFCEWTFELFSVFGYVNKTAVKILAHVFLSFSIFLGYIFRSGIPWSQDSMCLVGNILIVL